MAIMQWENTIINVMFRNINNIIIDKRLNALKRWNISNDITLYNCNNEDPIKYDYSIIRSIIADQIVG